MRRNIVNKIVAVLLVAAMAVFLCGFAYAAEAGDSAKQEANAEEATALTQSSAGTSSQTRYLIVGGAVLAVCAGFYVFLNIKTRRGK